MNKVTWLGVGITVFLAIHIPSWGQEIYRFVDETGRVIFTDRPPQDVEAETLPLAESDAAGTAGDESQAAQGGADRMERMMEMADKLQQDRYEREDRRAARRQAAEPMPQPTEDDVRRETGPWLSSGIWYPVRPPRPWWRPPGHHPPHGHRPEKPPGHHPERPPGYRPEKPPGHHPGVPPGHYPRPSPWQPPELSSPLGRPFPSWPR